jgi:hypothetical protein
VDISSMMAMNLQSLQMTAQTMVLDKAMGQDAQAIAAVMEMMPAQPQLATYAGHMDIRV